MEKLRIDLEDENLRLRFAKDNILGRKRWNILEYLGYIGEEEIEYLGYIRNEEVEYLSPPKKSFVKHDDIFDRQKLPVRPDVCLLQRVQGQRLQSWWGGNTKGEIST